MVESVGSIAAGIGAGAARLAHESLRSSDAQGSAVTGALATTVQKALSPNMHADPVSGVLVVQYLSGKGDVTTQLPSAVALAYLRSGLTETGQPREKADNVAHEAAGVLA